MRVLAGAALLGTLVVPGAAPAAVAEGRYCAGGMEIPSDCTLMDWQMCLEQARPQGGNCYANPNYRRPSTTAPKQQDDKRKRRER
jgi:hypothetical protein